MILRFILLETENLANQETYPDHFGNEGDDTEHTGIPEIEQPAVIQTSDLLGQKNPIRVDVVFIGIYAKRVEDALFSISRVNYTSEVQVYNSTNSRDVLAEFAKIHWKFNGTCTAGD